MLIKVADIRDHLAPLIFRLVHGAVGKHRERYEVRDTAQDFSDRLALLGNHFFRAIVAGGQIILKKRDLDRGLLVQMLFVDCTGDTPVVDNLLINQIKPGINNVSLRTVKLFDRISPLALEILAEAGDLLECRL
nr:hypothetical protein [Sporolactobacillus shoreae]